MATTMTQAQRSHVSFSAAVVATLITMLPGIDAANPIVQGVGMAVRTSR